MAFQNVNVKEHNLLNLAKNATSGIFGKRRTGKSTLAAHLIQKLSQSGVQRFVVFSGNRENMVEWARLIHPLYIHGKDMDTFIRIKDHQDHVVGKDRDVFEAEEHRRKAENPHYEEREYETPNHLRLGVILDDTGNDKNFMHAKAIKDACSNGRHYGFDLIVLLQYVTQLHPENRDQMDYIFLMQTTNSNSIDKIFKEYVTPTCCELNLFRYLLAACTDRPGRCMFIDNVKGGMVMATRMFFVKFPRVQRGLVGGDKYINFGRKHYLSRTRQDLEINKKPEMSPVAPEPEDTSHISHRLQDAEEDPAPLSDPEDAAAPVTRGSVVSLNRRRNLHFSKVRDGRHVFNDHRGNRIQIQLQNEQTGGQVEGKSRFNLKTD